MNSYFETELGAMFHTDSLVLLRNLPAQSIDLIMTSPPFALNIKKEYGNAAHHEYCDWFRPFAEQLFRVLKPAGSLVLDIAGGWFPRRPTRSLYHFELLIMLCREFGFHLAQELYWWCPKRLPSAAWTNIHRVRVKDAVNCLWWLSPTAWPKASNRRVLLPYSKAMRSGLKRGRTAKRTPSGHKVGEYYRDNGGAVPPNILVMAGAEHNPVYRRLCREHSVKPHPARFPQELPEFFIRMCTDPQDMVLDPFAGSCVTAEVAERLGRRWLAGELVEEYLQGATFRFRENYTPPKRSPICYSVRHPAGLWDHLDAAAPLASDGGRNTKVPRHRKAYLQIPESKT